MSFDIDVPDLSHERIGNAGVPGVWHFDSGKPGSSVLITALMHGNELCGAWALKELLASRIKPIAGKLTLAFCNLDAFDRFDKDNHDASRFVDVDLNRVWSRERLDNPKSAEGRRAAELRPWVEQADHLLDIHSMHEPSPPLLVVGTLPRNIDFGFKLGIPRHLIVDPGHPDGVRMRDFAQFGDARGDALAVLVECGFHGDLASLDVARKVSARFLLSTGVISAHQLPSGWAGHNDEAATKQEVFKVTQAVVASTLDFVFTKPWQGMECIPNKGTVIGFDNGTPVETPYDDCVLIMPSLRQLIPGVTVVRFGTRKQADVAGASLENLMNHLMPVSLEDSVDSERLWRRVEALSRFTDPDLPWTRRAFTDRQVQARSWLKEQMESAGLRVRTDEAGNLIGRREGMDPDARPLITGSHCDTVVAGGRFDGIIGVLAGIEVAQAMQEQGVVLRHPLEVIDFMSEEPSDYGISCVGSRAIAGMLDTNMLSARNHEGETLAEGLSRLGAQPSALNATVRRRDSSAAFVELHIEQGPVLESRQIPIGVVTHIVGVRRMAVTLIGDTGHSGTVPMRLRRDALVAASSLITEVYCHAKELDGPGCYVVATVGRILAEPNMANAIPGKVDLVLEIRSDNDAILEAFPDEVLLKLQERFSVLGVEATMKELTKSLVTRCDAGVMDVIEKSASMLGYGSMRLPSGAGHDGVYISATGPIGMIFVPCLNGKSHCHDEWLSASQLLAGARVLYRSLLELDGRLD